MPGMEHLLHQVVPASKVLRHAGFEGRGPARRQAGIERYPSDRALRFFQLVQIGPHGFDRAPPLRGRAM